MVRQSKTADAVVTPAATRLPTTAPLPSEAARSRLLRAGLKLFAAQGYSKTSTREVAEAAGVNVASIAYYFGDKAGLYKAVFFEPLGPLDTEFANAADGSPAALDVALQRFYAGFLAPLKSGEDARLCIKLRFREMLEPSGLWEQEVCEDIRPMHQHLVQLLCRCLPVATADDDVHRLATSLAGLAVYLHVSGDILDVLAPQLVADPPAIDQWVQRLTMYGLAMVQAERDRRGIAPTEASSCVR